MEVDYSAIDECKETSSDALLTAVEPAGGSLDDFPTQIAHGQLQI